MRYAKLRNIKSLYFGYEEIARSLGIGMASARVSANRYVKQGMLIRAKRNIYILRDRWEALGDADKFALANITQAPSYISLMTAMGYHGVTTQIQRNFIESIALKRTKEIRVGEDTLRYVKVDKKLYFGFIRKNNFFIATPEKALLDAVYLKSLGRYDFDITSVDFGKINGPAVKGMIGKFPKRTKELLYGSGYTKRA